METETTKDAAGAADVASLIAQAQTAYRQNRIKECLTLTRTALLADPNNTAALELQSAVRFDMQRDLSDARALIEESRNKPDAQKFKKAAEIILLKSLYLDPDSEGAKTLLASIRTNSNPPSSSSTPAVSNPPSGVSKPPTAPLPVAAEPVVQSAPRVEPAPEPVPVAQRTSPPSSGSFANPLRTSSPSGSYTNPLRVPSPPSGSQATPVKTSTPSSSGSGSTPSPLRAEAAAGSFTGQLKADPPGMVAFTTGTKYDKPEKKPEGRSRLTLPIIVVGIAVLVGGFLLIRQRMGGNASANETTLASGSGSTPKTSTSTESYTATTPGNSGSPVATTGSAAAVTATERTNGANGANGANERTANSKQSERTSNGAPALPGASASEAAPANSRNGSSNGAAAGMGSLAVSSPISAEIYLGDKYLGSTPATLQLPAGNQTLEYRHGDLRTVITHVVKANETTPALITFDAVVQLNARPWANVFIEGSTRLPLGQTPLSNVKLPIGSVLVFENPNFPSKSHKITVDDKTIQMVFP